MTREEFLRKVSNSELKEDLRFLKLKESTQKNQMSIALIERILAERLEDH